MATKKGSTTDDKGSKSTALVQLKADLAKQAEEIGKKIQAPSGDKIRLTKDKKFVLPDGTKSEAGAVLSVVVLDFVAGTNFYDRPYSEDDPIPPACFALGEGNHKTLIPSENAPDKQSDDCLSCPNNQFGSAGKGKACKNFYLLAVTQPDDDPESPVWLLKVSSTGLRSWDGHVGAVRAAFKTPPVGVVTDVWLDADSDFQSLRFGNPVENPNVALHNGRRAAALKRLLIEPDVSAYEAPKKVVRVAPKKK